MAVTLKKIVRPNPINRDIEKWYFTQERSGTVGMKEIAGEIAKRSSLSSGDVQSVLSNLVELLPVFLKIGQSIRLEGFGSFRLSVTSEGTETAEELTFHQVQKVKLVFLPSKELKRSFEDISFEITQ
ncbi:MAG: HU family DNA-binding protein [Spirochaetaceae bacterium]|jgi:predicted histone-like DNA-binding protein|nr:HU family DNA-binding protein [Spirochaetaceae bacterium]